MLQACDSDQDLRWMNQALALARQAESCGEVPVGAIVVHQNEMIGRGYNQVISTHDASAHAEIVALRDAGRQIGNYRLLEASLYVTLEPCAMCAAALMHARLKHVIFGALDPKAGAITSRDQLLSRDYFNHRVKWRGGVMSESCGGVLSEFFKKRR